MKYFVWNDSPDGTHWVACYIKKSKAYVFNPLGLPPDEPVWQYLVNKQGCDVVYNSNQIQSDTSETCGHWSMWFLSQIHSGKSFQEIIDSLSDDLLQNEKDIKKWFESI